MLRCRRIATALRLHPRSHHLGGRVCKRKAREATARALKGFLDAQTTLALERLPTNDVADNTLTCESRPWCGIRARPGPRVLARQTLSGGPCCCDAMSRHASMSSRSVCDLLCAPVQQGEAHNHRVSRRAGPLRLINAREEVVELRGRQRHRQRRSPVSHHGYRVHQLAVVHPCRCRKRRKVRRALPCAVGACEVRAVRSAPDAQSAGSARDVERSRP